MAKMRKFYCLHCIKEREFIVNLWQRVVAVLQEMSMEQTMDETDGAVRETFRSTDDEDSILCERVEPRTRWQVDELSSATLTEAPTILVMTTSGIEEMVPIVKSSRRRKSKEKRKDGKKEKNGSPEEGHAQASSILLGIVRVQCLWESRLIGGGVLFGNCTV